MGLREIGTFIEERTSLGSATARFLDGLSPSGAWLSRLLASAVAACFGVLALTGVALMMAYSPSSERRRSARGPQNTPLPPTRAGATARPPTARGRRGNEPSRSRGRFAPR